MTSEELSRQVIEQLRAQGRQAFWAGGCVRDRLLGVPAKDYDVATDALPEDLLRLFPDAIQVGVQFGVVLVRQAGAEVEVATFRTDHDYRDGRRPENVSFTRSPEEDVQRRDFTINGILCDPVDGRYLDFVGGRNDLEARIIRAIGNPDERFAEDKLRMLRAVRFAARLGFAIEAETLKSIQRHAREIQQISMERIRDEISRILTEGGARRGFELLDETGLLQVILPEIKALQGVEQSPQHHPEGDVWTHTMIMLSKLENPALTLALGTLLHDVGKPATFQRAPDRIRFNGHVEVGMKMAEAICQRLRYSRDQTEQAVTLVANHMRFMHLPDMRESTLKKFLRMERFDEHLELHRLDCLGSHGKLRFYEMARQRLEDLPEEQLRPPRLLSGDDLIEAGYEPGPRFQEILSDVEDAQLEGRLSGRDQALLYVRARYPKEGEKPS
ncbi:MAG: CCA tRNA nucleotidyltransferase [Acidobacteria bacterium]|nr:CCA tRNA nucleotidyltransferase [Acidobacteriota bacterium]